MKVPTMGHVRKAIDIAKKGGHKYKGIKGRITYDQNRWCGTSCCVFGHALILAGNKNAAEKGNGDMVITAKNKFMEKSKRHMALGIMLGVTNKRVLPILKKISGRESVSKCLKKAATSKIDDIRSFASSAMERIA